MHHFTQALIFTAATLLISCKSQKTSKERGADKNFFYGESATLALGSLKNEMATGESDFLRSFADHQIAWQKWDGTLLQKSKSAQLPIFAFVGSSLGEASTKVANEINQREDLRSKISSNNICTVIDTHVFPEIESLCYHLSTEIKKPTAFPMFLWLSHEGCPIRWYPVGDPTEESLDTIVDIFTTLNTEGWTRDSVHTIENSRQENLDRQDLFDLKRIEPATETRNKIFRLSTRQLASLHSPSDQNIDAIGGLIPSNSLELLAIGSHSKFLNKETRERCRTAARSVTKGLLKSAIKDPLDGSYFFARLSSDWSLPAFPKSLSSQARIASMLFKVGGILNDPEINSEALRLLNLIESEWLPENLTIQSPIGNTHASGSFFWSLDTLDEILSNGELALTKTTFSLEEFGNIPLNVDPQGKYDGLNSLTNYVPVSEIAEEHELTEEEVTAKLTLIKQKLLAHRKEHTRFVLEKTPTVYDLSCILRTQVARACYLDNQPNLKIAEDTATLILKNYWVPGEGLHRIVTPTKAIPARGADYMETSRALFLLYQKTLDERWFNASLDIMERAIANLSTETNLISETPPSERIIPIRQQNVFMIFRESTLGLADLVASRFSAITGNKEFQALMNVQLKLTTPMLKFSILNHTDLIASYALGENPIVAIFQGDPNSPAGKSLLSLLNDPEHLSYLTIRPESGSERLSPLPAIPATIGDASVVLIRENQSLGQASNPEKLSELLDSILSGK